ncbi:MAG: hypothetical protein ACO3JZ_05965 [Schleiferiaceae bacterium]
MLGVDFVARNQIVTFKCQSKIITSLMVKSHVQSSKTTIKGHKLSSSSKTVVKDPYILAYAGFVLLLPGLIALVPFNIAWLQSLDIAFAVSAAFGAFLLLIANSKIGWWIKVEDNVLYYSKFSVFSNWQKRRGVEYAISIETINEVKIDNQKITLYYRDRNKISFNVIGLKKSSKTAILKMLRRIKNSPISD